MKTLKKLLLTNWHYFSHEVIDIDQINFLTGENGSGKTTIIDALQLIVLGDTTGHFFNKSASDKSSRDLRGYLRCEIGDKNEDEKLYLRNGRFSSYVVTEFYDDEEKKPFTLGIVFDTYEDGSYDSKYFYYPSKIADNGFIENKIPMTQKQLNLYLLNNDLAPHFFNTNIDYREFIKTKFGNLSNNFFSLFKKAIPFAPINNIEQFITEYVCDVDNKIDVNKMQENFRNYKKLEIETNELSKRVNVLTEIVNKYNDWKQKQEAISIKKYIMDRSDLYLASSAEEEIKLRVEELKADIKENESMLSKCNDLLKEANAKKESLVEEKFQSDIYKRKAVYQEKYQQISKRIEELETSLKSIETNLLDYISSWSKAIENSYYELDEEYTKSSEGKLGKEILAKLKELEECIKTSSVKETALLDIFNQVNDFQTALKRKQFAMLNDDGELTTRITTCKNELKEIEAGKKPYDYRLIDFKESIRIGLKNKYEKDIEVNFLSDLIDIEDEHWRLAIETYMNTQRFYLIVEPMYVNDAIKIYNSIKSTMPYFDYGIVDTEKVILNSKSPLPNSLAEEITSSNKGAKAFCDMLLGALIKCSNIASLRNNPRSITADGMLYQNYVARSLNMKQTVSYIGSKSALKQKEVKENEIRELESKLGQISIDVNNIGKLTSLEFFNSNEIKTIAQTYEMSKGLESLRNEADQNKELMNSLSDSFLSTIEKTLGEVEKTIDGYNDDKEELKSSIMKSKIMIDNLLEKDLPNSKARVDQLKLKINAEYIKEWIANVGEPAFLDLLKDNKDPLSLYNSYKIEIESTLQGLSNLWRSIVDQRTKYNTIYELNYDAHSSDNSDYQNEYHDLAEIKLTSYLDKIKEAKDNAMKEFRNDFLAKLKENFDTVIRQIAQLNSALEYAQFGVDKYKFSVDPRREYKQYYEMINDPLLLTGTDIEAKEFSEKYGNTIENLFRQITFTDSNDARSELEQNINKYTDYRSYLKFDLIVTNVNGTTQRLSRTLGSKSGGETQTPFYISVLASFAQTYRLYLNNQNNGSIRLIVFDEAFSKMDAVRVEESIKLLRNFGLQAIVSAPTDKAQTISPLVDRTICVVRNNTSATTRSFYESK